MNVSLAFRPDGAGITVLRIEADNIRSPAALGTLVTVLQHSARILETLNPAQRKPPVAAPVVNLSNGEPKA